MGPSLYFIKKILKKKILHTGNIASMFILASALAKWCVGQNRVIFAQMKMQKFSFEVFGEFF